MREKKNIVAAYERACPPFPVNYAAAVQRLIAGDTPKDHQTLPSIAARRRRVHAPGSFTAPSGDEMRQPPPHRPHEYAGRRSRVVL